MAYQPKSYKKFVATAATATLVATAVVPAAFADEVTTAAFTDVAPQYADAVEFVVAQNIAKGLTETTFGVSAQIKRGDAAIMIANAAGLNDEKAPASGFSDVPTRGVLAINSLKAKGVVNGKSATNFGFNDSITRGEAAIMLANAFDLEGDVKNVKFTDVNDRYLAAVAALVEEGVTNGISATQFGTTNNIKRGDFARFVYALEEYIGVNPEAPVLNYTGESTINVAYGANFTVPAVTATDDKDANVAVTTEIKNAAGNTVSAIDTKVPGKYTITYSAVDSDGNKAKNLVVTVNVANGVEGQVASVVATSLNTVVVNFNEPVDEATATDYTNYSIEGATLATADFSLSSDKKSVVIKLASPLTNDSRIRVTIEDVEDLDGNVFPDYNELINVEDTTLPTISSTEYVKANDTLTIKFSEDLDTVGNVQITDANGVVQTVTPSFTPGTDTLTINTSSLTDGQNYRLTMVGAQDLAGNFFANNTVTYAFKTGSDDTVKPTVQNVKLLSNDLIEVTVSEKLSNAGTLNGAALVADSKLDNANDYKVSANGLVYTIKITPLTNNTVNTFAFNGQIDLAGNEVTTAISKVVTYNDQTAPAVSSVKATGKVLTVVFSEPIQAPTGGGTLVSPDGIQYTVAQGQMTLDATDTTNRTLTVDLSSNITGTPATGNYKLNLAKGIIVDAESNSQALTINASLSAATDTEKPEVDGFVYTADANNGTVAVSFDKDMGASAINVANYTVDGVRVFETAYFDTNKENVVLTIKDGAFEFDGVREFKISNVTDLSGNALDTYTRTLTFEDNTSPKLVSAKLNNTQDGIVLSFNESIDPLSIAEGTAVADFAVYVGDQLETGVIESVVATDTTNKTFALTLSDALTATEYAKTITVRPTKDIDVTDANGNQLTTFTSVSVSK